MSIRVLDWVLNSAEAKGSDRLVLIALADYANDDGGGAYPSIPKVADKAKVGERTAERSLKTLEREGYITETGKTPRGTRSWRVNMTPANLAGATPAKHDSLNGADGGSLSIGEPSLEPSKKKKVVSNSNKGERYEPDPKDPVDQAIVAIFDAWHAGTGKNGSSYLSKDRAAKILARLRESAKGSGERQPEAAVADARDELLEAVKGMCTSKWHVANGQTDFLQLFRNRERVMFFLERLQQTAAEEPTASERFAAYDDVIENRSQA